MLSLHAISEAAIAALPDRLTGRVSSSGVVSGAFDVVTDNPATAILVDPGESPVFALEIYAALLSRVA